MYLETQTAKVLSAIDKAIAWHEKHASLVSRFALVIGGKFATAYNLDQNLRALKILRQSSCTDEDLIPFIRQLGYGKHSLLAFLHDEGVSVGGRKIDSLIYVRLDAMAFGAKTDEERKAIYDRTLEEAAKVVEAVEAIYYTAAAP
jgi:hypothetical protein